MESLLNVKNLSVRLHVQESLVKIVDGVDLSLNRGETIGIVGETGAGKTVTALAILGILQPLGKGKPLWEVEGEVWYKGKDLFKLSEEERRKIRGEDIALITQNPIPSLHPIEEIGWQTGEGVEAHKEDIERQKVIKLVIEHLGKVEIKDAQKRFHNFREQFSGGEGQRILIAMSLIRNPALLVADEPTSALDVTVQRQILELLKAMKEQFKLSMLLITHNIAVVAEMCDHVYVMYAGKIAEHGDVKAIFYEPTHPFTRGLLTATPTLEGKSFKFEGIPGEPPNPLHPISGCRFHPRCKYAELICSKEEPPLIEVKPGHRVACLRINEVLASQN